MKELKTPDITLAQIIAVLGAAFALTAAFGLDISQDKRDGIVQLVTVLAPIVVAADAFIRHGRSRALALPPKGVVAEDNPVTTSRTASTRRKTTR